MMSAMRAANRKLMRIPAMKLGACASNAPNTATASAAITVTGADADQTGVEKMASTRPKPALASLTMTSLSGCWVTSSS